MSDQYPVAPNTGQANTFTLVVNTNKNTGGKEFVEPGTNAPYIELKRVADFFEKARRGSFTTNTHVITQEGYASSGVTFNGLTNSAQISVAGLTFTSILTGTPTNVQFLLGSGDTAAASNAAAAINAYAPAAQLVTATASTNGISITSVVPGVVGNQIGLRGTGNVTELSTSLVGGTQFTDAYIHYGQ
jgi:hypothetical protein